ncbi:CoA transferase, partial [Dehalococcoidia bacterium]|nr:CoA transferase [Dehalococcoidia bacterium]
AGAAFKSADVVVASSTSSGAEGLSVSYEEVSKLNGDVVYLSLPGFSEDHPLSGVAAREGVIGAYTGIYTDRSQDGSTGPSFISLPHASIFGAMVAAPAIIAALIHRTRTGRGQQVTVPLFDAMYTAMGSQLVRRPDVPASPSPISPVIGRFYQCADGRWVNINASYERSLRPLLEAVGHPEWYPALTDPDLVNDEVAQTGWELKFAEVWMHKTALEWEQVMDRVGVPGTMCRTTEEWMDTAHANESGAVSALEDPLYGHMRQVGVQVRLSDTPGDANRPAPTLGQHTMALVAELLGTS